MKNRAPSSHDYAEPRNRVSVLPNLRPVEPERSLDAQMDEQDGYPEHDITLTTDSSTKFQGMLNKLKALFRKNDIVKSASLPRPKNGPKNKISFDALEKNNLEEFPNVVTYQTKAQELDFVDSLNNIPSYHALISLKGGTLEVAESISPQVAVLALTDQEPRSDVKVPLAIILTAEFIETHAYHSLRERARTKNYLIKTTILGTTGVIDRLYSRHGTTEIAAQTQTLDESSAEHGRAVSMIRMAVDRGASDIHIELRGDTAIVRMRIDSVLVKVDELTSAVMNNVMGHIYTKMAVVNSRSDPVYNELNMQSCMIQYKTDLYSIKLRYASSPVLGGTDFVLRVLKDSAQTITEIPRLPDLGYSELQSRQLKMASHKIFGAILLSGGTGSGKSTTIRTLIAWHPQLLYTKTISVEDPVEYQIPHTSQMSVQRSISQQGGEDPFVAYKRQIVRSDPDRVFIGEIRDSESGSLAKSMVLTGHQVFATVHANSAFEVFKRLSLPDIGIDRITLSGKTFINASVYQMLFPKLCSHCKIPLDNVASRAVQREVLRHRFGLDTSTMFAQNPSGCSHCKSTGIKGQTVAAEVMIPSLEILAMVAEGKDTAAEIHWRGTRTTKFDDPDTTGKTYYEHGLYKASQGQIDPDVLEKVDPLEIYLLVKRPFDTFDENYVPKI